MSKACLIITAVIVEPGDELHVDAGDRPGTSSVESAEIRKLKAEDHAVEST